jgi:hypothetical protein
MVYLSFLATRLRHGELRSSYVVGKVVVAYILSQTLLILSTYIIDSFLSTPLIHSPHSMFTEFRISDSRLIFLLSHELCSFPTLDIHTHSVYLSLHALFRVYLSAMPFATHQWPHLMST